MTTVAVLHGPSHPRHHRAVRSARSLLVFALVMLGVIACAAPCAAQSRAALARSRTLFEQGLAHAEAERWQEARESFEQALAITERPSILLNLATAQAETGALVASAASYRRFLEIATTRDQRQNREEATRALAAVERRLGHLEIDTSALAPDDVVRLDDTDVVPSDTAIDVDPGEHRLAVRRGSRDVRVERVTVAEGETQTVTLVVPDLRPTRVAETTEEPIETPPTQGGGDDSLAIGLGVGLGVGALVIAGVIVGVVVATSSPGAPYQGNVGTGVIRF